MADKKDKKQLYYVAVIPDEELCRQIHDLKLHIAYTYHSKAALKSPPHITLFMPFRWKEEKEDRLFTTLGEVASSWESFPVQLNAFGAFRQKTLYIHVEESKQLAQLRKEVIKSFKRQLNIFDQGFEERPFRPHITVAFRDLKKPMFKKAWEEEFKEKAFEASFDVHQLTLLKHNGKHWDRYKEWGFD